MASNGTPRQWQDRAKLQQPRRIVTSQRVEDRPALRFDPDPLFVPGEDTDIEQKRADDVASLVLVFGILAILVGLSVWAPDLLRLFREWWLG
jgi:hypothetical protein